jgi:small subunit ribosomal protein S2
MAKYKVPTIEELIEAGVHFGHQVRRWHPKMEKYIYMVNKNVHIIDLEETEKLLKKACEHLYEVAKSGKTIIFVGTKRQSKEIIEAEAKRCGAMYVSQRWIGGTITNFKMIRANLDKLVGFIKGREEGKFDKNTKKERLLIDREIEKMMLVYGGIINLKGTPGALFIIDPKREKTAIREAVAGGIKTVALVDTNTDPSNVDFPIPANDDAIKSLALLVRTISSAVEEGYKDFEKSGKEAKEAQEALAAAEKAPEAKLSIEPKITVDEGHIQIIAKEIEKEIEKVVEEVKEKTVDKPITEAEIKEIKKRGRPKKGE